MEKGEVKFDRSQRARPLLTYPERRRDPSVVTSEPGAGFRARRLQQPQCAPTPRSFERWGGWCPKGVRRGRRRLLLRGRHALVRERDAPFSAGPDGAARAASAFPCGEESAKHARCCPCAATARVGSRSARLVKNKQHAQSANKETSTEQFYIAKS